MCAIYSIKDNDQSIFTLHTSRRTFWGSTAPGLHLRVLRSWSQICFRKKPLGPGQRLAKAMGWRRWQRIAAFSDGWHFSIHSTGIHWQVGLQLSPTFTNFSSLERQVFRWRPESPQAGLREKSGWLCLASWPCSGQCRPGQWWVHGRLEQEIAICPSVHLYNCPIYLYIIFGYLRIYLSSYLLIYLFGYLSVYLS